MVVRDNPRLVAKVLALDLLVNVAGRPLVALWLKLIVDGAGAGDTGAAVWPALGLAGSLALQGTASVGTAMLFGDLHESSARVLTGDIMRLTSTTPGIEHHERPEYADRIALLRSQGRLLTNFVNTFGSNGALVVRIALTIVLLASVHPALLAMPLLAVPSIWTGRRANRIWERTKEATAERVRTQEHLWKVTTTPGPAKEAQVNDLGGHLIERHRRLWDQVAKEGAAAILRGGALRALGWSSFAAGYVGAIVLVLSLVSDGAATAGDVLLVIALTSDVNGQVARAAGLAGDAAGTFLALDRLQWLSDYAEAARRPPDEPAPVPDRLADGIAFEGVTFRYPGTDTDVLADIDLRLPAGSVVALVGANGAGKSTLVKLLTRCYEPSAGRIAVDGVDLRRLDTEAWRRHLSGGFQDFFRFQETLQHSVGIGDLDRLEDRRAATAASNGARPPSCSCRFPMASMPCWARSSRVGPTCRRANGRRSPSRGP